MSKIHEWRAKRDYFFEKDLGSPLTPTQRERFAGLEYFRKSPAYCVRASITVFTPRSSVTLGTSKGGQAHFWRYGWAKFTLCGKPECVTLYIPVESLSGDSFFIPFTDETNGAQSYGGGRYLDAASEEEGFVTLDFNLAYNPYCAYNDRWSCVLPPVENHIEQPVRAGERVYPDHE